jgi:hypothetical protein
MIESPLCDTTDARAWSSTMITLRTIDVWQIARWYQNWLDLSPNDRLSSAGSRTGMSAESGEQEKQVWIELRFRSWKERENSRAWGRESSSFRSLVQTGTFLCWEAEFLRWIFARRSPGSVKSLRQITELLIHPWSDLRSKTVCTIHHLDKTERVRNDWEMRSKGRNAKKIPTADERSNWWFARRIRSIALFSGDMVSKPNASSIPWWHDQNSVNDLFADISFYSTFLWSPSHLPGEFWETDGFIFRFLWEFRSLQESRLRPLFSDQVSNWKANDHDLIGSNSITRFAILAFCLDKLCRTRWISHPDKSLKSKDAIDFGNLSSIRETIDWDEVFCDHKIFRVRRSETWLNPEFVERVS